MARNPTDEVLDIVEKMGCATLAQTGEFSMEEMQEKLGDAVDCIEAARLHGVVRQACDQALLASKHSSIRASPLLPGVLEAVAEPAPMTEGQVLAMPSGADSPIEARDTQYTAPGDVASQFSPAAYLSELYRQARMLYPEQSPWHIDQRRPDLKQLILDQKNLDTPVTALSLSNEILLGRARVVMSEDGSPAPSDEQLLDALSTQVGSPGVPYHHHHDRVRQVFALKDPQFEHLLAASAFATHLDDVFLACVHYSIPPALRTLLTDEINKENAKDKFINYFPGTTPEWLLQPASLRNWFGLSDAELQDFMGALDRAEYKGQRLTTRVDDNLVEVSISGASSFINYVRLYPLPGGQWQLAFNLKVSDVDYFVTNGAFRVAVNARDFGVELLSPNTEYRQLFDGSELPSEFTFTTYWQKSRAAGGAGHRSTFSVRCEQSSADA
ncbi:Tc toxin subunit A [Pseudomonas sp. NPDC089554]|uniref:Tc toxin subunit A n=1 Tax=Pseudomonas sp. NPDC089554 TaxID=3390653 RepID=UPI003D011C07